MQGIYQIRNIENNKVYIGSSIDIEGRWKSHKNLLNRNKHHSEKLQNDWNKYGENNFIFEILEEFNKTSRTQLFLLEQEYIDKYEPHINGYNINATSSSDNKYELNKHDHILNAKSNIRKIGNSLGVIIPNHVIKEMSLSNGSTVYISYRNQKITIEKDASETINNLENSKDLVKEEVFDDITIQIKISRK